MQKSQLLDVIGIVKTSRTRRYNLLVSLVVEKTSYQWRMSEGTCKVSFGNWRSLFKLAKCPCVATDNKTICGQSVYEMHNLNVAKVVYTTWYMRFHNLSGCHKLF
jgi:hypothetical protein